MWKIGRGSNLGNTATEICRERALSRSATPERRRGRSLQRRRVTRMADKLNQAEDRKLALS